jgi:hypothetical protein
MSVYANVCVHVCVDGWMDVCLSVFALASHNLYLCFYLYSVSHIIHVTHVTHTHIHTHTHTHTYTHTHIHTYAHPKTLLPVSLPAHLSMPMGITSQPWLGSATASLCHALEYVTLFLSHWYDCLCLLCLSYVMVSVWTAERVQVCSGTRLCARMWVREGGRGSMCICI